MYIIEVQLTYRVLGAERLMQCTYTHILFLKCFSIIGY